MPPLALIVAYDRNRVIGKDGGMPDWYEPEDLKHFKRTTMGHAIIMGRKSAEALGKPLPGRRNLAVTRRADWRLGDFEVFTDLDKAIAAARVDDDMPFITGGGEIYRLALPQVTRCYLTEIDVSVEGDTTFVELDEREWVETERRVSGPLTFRTLERGGVAGGEA